jgi:xanthine/uracil permease
MWSSAGKFGGVFAAIPQPIVAAILCITFGMVGEYFLHLNRFQLKTNSESQCKAIVLLHWQYSLIYS